MKSQYRYIKERIPNIDEMNFDDADVLRKLISECQGRGISPANLKYLKPLRIFLIKASAYGSSPISAMKRPAQPSKSPDHESALDPKSGSLDFEMDDEEDESLDDDEPSEDSKKSSGMVYHLEPFFNPKYRISSNLRPGLFDLFLIFFGRKLKTFSVIIFMKVVKSLIF